MKKIIDLVNTGSEILTGFSRHATPGSWDGFSHNWNLLLTVNGCVQISYGSHRCQVPEHSLILLSPGENRRFTTDAAWGALWIHYEKNLYFNDEAEWNEIVPGVKQLSLETEDFRILHYLFLQVIQVATKREACWKRLLYCLIQEIILRGNSVFGRGLETYNAPMAHKMLSLLKQNLSMDEIARRCNMSRSAFFAKFTQTFEMSPRKYREKSIMARVLALLENTDLSIAEISQQTEMSSPSYLSARFKLYYGIYPREYRQQFRASLPKSTLPDFLLKGKNDK